MKLNNTELNLRDEEFFKCLCCRMNVHIWLKVVMVSEYIGISAMPSYIGEP